MSYLQHHPDNNNNTKNLKKYDHLIKIKKLMKIKWSLKELSCVGQVRVVIRHILKIKFFVVVLLSSD